MPLHPWTFTLAQDSSFQSMQGNGISCTALALVATSSTAGVWQVAQWLYYEVGEEVSPWIGALARREVRRQRDRWQFETDFLDWRARSWWGCCSLLGLIFEWFAKHLWTWLWQRRRVQRRNRRSMALTPGRFLLVARGNEWDDIFLVSKVGGADD